MKNRKLLLGLSTVTIMPLVSVAGVVSCSSNSSNGKIKIIVHNMGGGFWIREIGLNKTHMLSYDPYGEGDIFTQVYEPLEKILKKYSKNEILIFNGV